MSYPIKEIMKALAQMIIKYNVMNTNVEKTVSGWSRGFRASGQPIVIIIAIYPRLSRFKYQEMIIVHSPPFGKNYCN